MSQKTQKVKKIAFLVTCAAILQMSESMIPHPIPGIRLGLANMIALVAMIQFGFWVALEIAVLRILISSFVMGTFLSPTFFLSFSGGFLSTIVMGLALKSSNRNPRMGLSLFGISILGAATHNITQITLVYFILLKHQSIFLMLPWLGVSSVITGWITGLVASQVTQKLLHPKSKKMVSKTDVIERTSFYFVHYRDGTSFIHHIPPQFKILSMIIFAVTVLFLDRFDIYAILFLFMLSLFWIIHIPFRPVLSGIKKLLPFVVISFFMPILINRDGNILFHYGFLTVTGKGLEIGGLFISRIILLMSSASLLIQTTHPKKMILGIKWILKPLEIFGMDSDRTSNIIMISWHALPELWDQMRHQLKAHKKHKFKLTHMISAISEIIVSVYRLSEEESS